MKRAVAFEALVAALLRHGDQTLAAAETGLSPRTVRRWMALPEFQRIYSESRRAVLLDAVSSLQARTARAVAVLGELLDAEADGVRLQAAKAVIENAVRCHELLDLSERMAALEEALDQREAHRGSM